jgi:hypothetical protein
MANRLRSGKAYEHTIIGMLTLENFDVYQPVVDDQAIDGIIRVRAPDQSNTTSFSSRVSTRGTASDVRQSA